MFTILFSILGCKKDETVVVTGKVSEGYLNQGIGNVQLELDYNEISGGSYSAGFKRLNETTTDDNGNFTFEFDRVQAVSYRITAQASGYETAVASYGGDKWSIAEDNIANLDIFETAELEISLVNAFPVAPDDKILFQLMPHSEECTSCCTETILNQTGVDTTFICKLYANQTIQYDYTIISSGSAASSSGTLDIVPGSGNKIEIAF